MIAPYPPRLSRCSRALLVLVTLAPAAGAQQIDEVIGDSMYRIWSGPTAQTNARPSIALDGPWPDQGAPPGPLAVNPDFSSAGGRFFADIDAPDSTSFYATGSVPGPLLRNGRFTTCWNTDAYGWSDSTQSLYESHPWVLAVRPDGTAFGLLADTTERCDIDLTGAGGADIRFAADNYDFPIIYIERDTPQEVCAALADLTGHAPMPPLWAIGYHQCRYQYAPQSTVLAIAQEFRNRSIPADIVWVDIGYMNNFRTFTFNPADFPDPAGLNADLQTIGFKGVWTSNPGAPPDPSFFLYNEGIAGDHFVKNSSGVNDYVGPMWPGDYLWADFTRAATRQWWADTVESWVAANDVGGVWIDMNEPAVFVGSKTMPEDNIHRADPALGGTGDHARYHNVYGMLMAEATRAGLLQARPDERPFILARANYIGGHRHAAVWSGDNIADNYHYGISIANILNVGLSGQPFSGPDIGGFVNDISPDLYEKWIAVGALFPFSRGHTGTAQQKEPWAFGADVEDTARLALNRRYRLLPHIYTAFYQAHTQGLPVMRPLFFAEPDNPTLRSVDDTFLLGDALVVSTANAATSACDAGDPGFPAPTTPLVRFGFPQTDLPGAPSDLDDPVLPEMYLTAGAIIPSGPLVQTTSGYTLDPLTLIVALDDDGTATGILYEDDYDGFDYLSGDYLLTTYTASQAADTVTVSVASSEGTLPRPARTLNVRLLLPGGAEITASGTDGQPVLLTIPPAARAAETTDGCDIPTAFAGTSLTIQSTPTAWGDNFNEINALYAAQETDAIRIGITGNLDLNGNALALFIDAAPGGHPVVDTAELFSPPAGLQDLTGTTFDAGFEPDTLLYINAFSGTLYVDQIELPTGQTGVKTYRGNVPVDSGQSLLSGAENPNAMRIALSNANFLGVTSVDASDPESAEHGFEMRLPFADLPITDPQCQRVRVAAMIVNGGGVVATQVLPPVDVASTDLGVAPNLSLIAGAQFTSFALTNPVDMDSDGDVDVFDFALFAIAFGDSVPPGSKGDPNSDGAVNVLDFGDLALRFGCGT